MRGDGRGPRCVHLLSDTHDAGAENQCRYLLEGLHASGELESELVYFGAGRAHSLFEGLGIPLLHVPRLRRFRYDCYGRARRLRRAYAWRPPDILHTWLLESNCVGLVAARAWPQTRVVITQRGSWGELDYPAPVRLQRLLLGRADHAVSNSPGGAQMLAELGLRRDRISIIPNGIPPERVEGPRDRAAVRAALGWDGHEVVIWIGRANDRETAGQKDVDTLFAAVESLRRTHPSTRLVMVGATEQELERVGFRPPQWAMTLGWRTDTADLLNAADLLILSSRSEGNSNVVGEAMLAGLPVATTDCGGHCRAVEQAGGRVVPAGRPNALAVAAAELLADPPNRRAVREAAIEALSVRRMVDSHIRLYRRLLAEPRPGG